MEHIDPESVGWDSSGLALAVEFAESCQAAQLVVCHRQGILAQAVFDPDPVDVYAVQKGLLYVLVAIAEEKYLLEISDPVNHHLDPEWTNLSPWDEASLTIETLLSMTTGMDDELNALGIVGETWRYNNTAYNYLKKILSIQSGLDLNELTRTWLLEPLGMSETRWVERNARLPDGTPFTGLSSTAADLTRLGLMVLKDGDGIIPKYYLDQMSRPGSKENPAWGLCWWNNHQEFFKVPMREEKTHSGALIPDAPADLIAARGAQENYLYVVPGLDLVVAKTTRVSGEGQRPPRFEREFWSLLMRARLA
ncbi:MAG: serine hydrolase [bacterium]|nr:class C beta-lactamase-related serine hydrolase [Gammaproteobacteria bacterium]HIL98858.1 class C beta-lactamase-related serine hydrolase [Pseudomonadales bacterium]